MTRRLPILEVPIVATKTSVSEDKVKHKETPKQGLGLFSGMGGLSSALNDSASAPNQSGTGSKSDSQGANLPMFKEETNSSQNINSSTGPDYQAILTNFYQQHNPGKVNEVSRTLIKYKGHEKSLFAKLAKKYNVPNPLDERAGSSASNSATFGPVPTPSPFASTANQTPAPSPFSASTFGTSNSPVPSVAPPFGSTATSAPFGSTTTSTFGTPSGSSSSFGTSQSASFGKPGASPFSQPAPTASTTSPFVQPATTPFGQTPKTTTPMSSPFGNTPGQSAMVGAPAFGGKTAREILFAFYQQRNPSKISDVDKLLTKYAGQEEKLLRNLAKKYNLDPTTFGLTAAPVSAGTTTFGSSSMMGQAATPFGQPPTVGTFGSMANQPSQGFSSFGQASQGATGFGPSSNNTAQPAPSGFGSFGNTGGFGSSPTPTTPFGAPRR